MRAGLWVVVFFLSWVTNLWGGPVGEKNLVVLLESAPRTLEPLHATDAAGVRISHQLIFEPLVRLGDRLKISGVLAARWTRETPRRYRFFLKENVKFHDGTPLKADDVVHTFSLLMAPETKSPYGAMLRDKIAQVKSRGSFQVVFTLKKPFASFLSDLELPILPRSATGSKSGLVGTGPFRFVHSKVNEVKLAPFPGHHSGQPPAQGVVFKVVRDPNTRLLKLRKGDVHLAINSVPVSKLLLFQRKPLRDRFNVVEGPGLSYQYLGLNLRDPILGNVKVRRALAHAINRDVLIRYRQKGHARPAVGLMAPGSPYTPTGLKDYAFDPAEANRLLDEAGFPRKNDHRFTLHYKTTTDRHAAVQARVIRSDLARVGIEVKIRSYEWGTFYEDIIKGNFQMFSLRWIGVSDPDFYYELFHSSRTPPAGRNRVFYKNPVMDALLEKGRLEADQNRRKKVYQKIQQILLKDLPYISLWHNNNVAVVAKEVKNFKLHPTGGFQHLPQVRLEQKAASGG